MKQVTEFPAAIRALRRKLKLTQEGLAQRLGATKSTVSGWEQGAHLPEAKYLAKMAEMGGGGSLASLLAGGAEDSHFGRETVPLQGIPARLLRAKNNLQDAMGILMKEALGGSRYAEQQLCVLADRALERAGHAERLGREGRRKRN